MKRLRTYPRDTKKFKERYGRLLIWVGRGLNPTSIVLIREMRMVLESYYGGVWGLVFQILKDHYLFRKDRLVADLRFFLHQRGVHFPDEDGDCPFCCPGEEEKSEGL